MSFLVKGSSVRRSLKLFVLKFSCSTAWRERKICKDIKGFLHNATYESYWWHDNTKSCEYGFYAVWPELVRLPTSWENTLPVTLLATIWELFVKTLYRTGQWYFPTATQKDKQTERHRALCTFFTNPLYRSEYWVFRKGTIIVLGKVQFE